MKKLFILLLVLCLVFAGIVSYVAYVPMPIADEQPLQAEPAYEGETLGEDAAENTAEAEPAYKGLDYEAILTLHDEDEIVGTINERDVTWREYFYWLYMQATQVDSMSVYYGIEPDWNEQISDGQSLSRLCLENTEYMLRQLDAIEVFAAENGIELTAEDEAAIAAQIEEEKVALVGEDADEAEFDAMLLEMHMSRDIFDRILKVNALIERGYTQLYGENGELANAADVVAYLEENEYMSAHHILIMSIDPATGMKLDEAAIEESRAQAQALAEELKAIEDDMARLERFNELKAELCDDTGKVAYPDGYTYTPGTMYPEFEEACLAQEPYQVSDVVETGVGFHVVMTLPLDADALVFASSGQPSTARILYTNDIYNQRLTESIDNIAFEYAEGFEDINLGDYVLE